MNFLTVQNITAGYNGYNVINNVSFEADSGCLLGVLGANGSGKTTLLKAICGILHCKGSVILDGVELNSLSSKNLAKVVSYIPQRSGISIDISALDVVLMGFHPRLKLLENPDRNMKNIAIEALAEVGLSDKANMNYLHLSEGQKQLCILARTLVSEAKLLILDEPESALDFNYRHQMLVLLKNRVASGICSAVVSLHDPMLALNFSDKLLLLFNGEVLGIIEPQRDSLEKMEKMLGAIYGNISLHRCKDKKGVSQLVMLREDC